MVFAPGPGHWQERLRWQAPLYKQISGALGDFFDIALLPATASTPWRLVAVHGTPWCTSRFSLFAIDLLQPTAAPTHPRILWHTQRDYSRFGESPITLKASADTFELRLNADAMQFDIDNSFERRVIYRYRVTGDTVTRLQPIALNARGFVEEWLSMPWPEAAIQTADPASPALKAVHQNFQQRQATTGDTLIESSFGPVLACKTPHDFQVEMRSTRSTASPGKPGGDTTPLPSTFYRLHDTGNGYQLLSATTHADPQCTGPDLMRKKQ